MSASIRQASLPGETMKQTQRRLSREFDSINGAGAATKFIESLRVERNVKFLTQTETIVALHKTSAKAAQSARTISALPAPATIQAQTSADLKFQSSDLRAVDLIESYIAIDEPKKREEFRAAHSATLRKSRFRNSLAYWRIQSAQPLTWNERAGFFFTASEVRRSALSKKS